MGQNIVHCKEILNTAIINYENCGINVWLEPEECLGDFDKF
jgi:hypothetical protein